MNKHKPDVKKSEEKEVVIDITCYELKVDENGNSMVKERKKERKKERRKDKKRIRIKI